MGTTDPRPPADDLDGPGGPEPWRAVRPGGPAGAPRGVVPALWGLVAAIAVLALAVAGLATVVGVSAAAVLADPGPLSSEPYLDDSGGLEPGDDYGDNATLDALWDACADEDWAACDELFEISDVGSGYEDFGGSCGDLRPGQEPGTCEESLG